MYKVFIDNVSIIFTDSKDLQENAVSYSAELLKDLTIDLPILLEKLNGVKELFIVSEDTKADFKRLFASYKLIEAAGGIVCFGNEIICIKRNGFWDIPKGKIEKKESIEFAAIREVEEECGVTGLQVKDEICTTFHTYTYKSKRVLKKTYWFSLSIPAKQTLLPQTDEGITEAKWIDLQEVDRYFTNTFLSIQEVWVRYKEITKR